MLNATEKIAISASGVSASIGKTLILHAIDLQLAAGRWTSIVGPNGAGKSTLLRTLAGLLPSSGSVHLLGRPLADWPRNARGKINRVVLRDIVREIRPEQPSVRRWVRSSPPSRSRWPRSRCR